MVHDCQLWRPVCQGREVMTTCFSPLWTKTGVLQKLPANGLHISLVTVNLVHLVAPHASSLQKGATRFQQDYMDLLGIDTVLDSTQYKMRDLENSVLLDIFHINRLKLAFLFYTIWYSKHSRPVGQSNSRHQ